jgi:tetratricopeptide (TPR) repeat protein
VPAPVRRAILKGLAPAPDRRHPSMAALLAQLGRDPVRARRHGLVIAAMVSSLAFGAWSAVAHRDKPGLTLCRGAAAELAATWNPARRAAVKQAFLAVGVDYAADTFERVASALDAYGTRWIDMRTQACEATRIHGVQSDAVLDLRMGCLDRQRRSLETLVTAFANEPDRRVVDKAVEASLGLGGLALCADIEVLEQEEPLPERPEDRETLAELRGQLAAVDQLEKLGKRREAAALLDALAPRARALDFPPLDAELRFYMARSTARLQKYAEAEQMFDDTIELALEWKMLGLAARAGAQASFLVGYRLRRHREGLIYAAHAQGLTRGRGDELEAYALSNAATVYCDAGEYAEAGERFERASAILEKVFGPDHPSVATSLYNLAVVYRNQGEYARAEELNKRAIAILEKVLGPNHPAVGTPLANLAEVYSSQGRYAEAEALYERAVAVEEQALGPEHPEVAPSLEGLAEVYRQRGAYERAEALSKRALAVVEKVFGPDHAHVAGPLVGLAATYEAQRRHAEALPLLERARAIRERESVAPSERAEVAFALARVSWASHQDRARSRSLVKQAVALYESAGPGADKKRLEAEQWSAEHR